MATNDMYTSLESSNNLNSAPHASFHRGRLFITLPSTNSIDNRMSLASDTDVVPLRNSTNNNQQHFPSTRITNNIRPNICQIIFNRNSSQRNSPAPVQDQQQQQPYRQTQGATENPSDMAPPNSSNNTTQDMPSPPSPITSNSISTTNEVADSESGSNTGNTGTGNSSIHS